MKILGIDSSGLVASVALVADDIMVAEYTIHYKKTHSQTLLPMLDEIVKMAEIQLNEIDAIAVAAGPGSFTGLRIGSSTAKGLGLALKKPIIGIPTVEGLAYNLYGTEKLICPLMDAKRNQVYTGIYEFESNKMKVLMKQKVVALSEIIEELNQMGRAVIFLGDGVEVYKNEIEEMAAIPIQFAPAHLSKQRAGAIATLGQVYYKEGKYETAEAHKPVYLRLSQAERELLERKKREEVLNKTKSE